MCVVLLAEQRRNAELRGALEGAREILRRGENHYNVGAWKHQKADVIVFRGLLTHDRPHLRAKTQSAIRTLLPSDHGGECVQVANAKVLPPEEVANRSDIRPRGMR